MSANISSQMSSLVKKIEKWDFEFNQNGFSSVSNDVYDAIFEELISLEKNTLTWFLMSHQHIKFFI